jgi:RNA polymerase sigma-70 factor (ECF subfamily)
VIDALLRVADTDEELLERTRRGDAVAFAALASRYWHTVHRLVWNMLSDAVAPAQIAEATFLSLLRSGDAFPPGVPFRTSLYRVVLGESWRRLRSATRIAQGATRAERSVTRKIREGVQRLEVLDRAAFVLREVESLSSEEAGAILGIAPASVRQRTHRATLMMTAFVGRDERVEQGT